MQDLVNDFLSKKKRAEALFSFSETDRQFISGWHNSTGNRILRHPHSGGCGMFRPLERSFPTFGQEIRRTVIVKNKNL